MVNKIEVATRIQQDRARNENEQSGTTDIETGTALSSQEPEVLADPAKVIQLHLA